MFFHLDVFGIQITPMRVIFVPKGSSYPNLKSNEISSRNSLEFYDFRYKHTPDGQFISRYYLSTLNEGRDHRYGLDLMGGVDSWKIDAQTFNLVLVWANYLIKHAILPVVHPEKRGLSNTQIDLIAEPCKQ